MKKKIIWAKAGEEAQGMTVREMREEEEKRSEGLKMKRYENKQRSTFHPFPSI